MSAASPGGPPRRHPRRCGPLSHRQPDHSEGHEHLAREEHSHDARRETQQQADGADQLEVADQRPEELGLGDTQLRKVRHGIAGPPDDLLQASEEERQPDPETEQQRSKRPLRRDQPQQVIQRP